MNPTKHAWTALPAYLRQSLLIIVSLTALVLFLLLGRAEKPDGPELDFGSGQLFFTVGKGPLAINVIESGTIKARDQTVIKSEVEGRTSILWIIAEGTRVKKGDLLIELDASRLQNELVDQQIKVENSEAAFIRARETLDVVKNQARSDVDKAVLALQFARQDLRKYTEGEYPKEEKAAEARITVAREELRRAEEKLKWSRILFDQKYLSETELKADELAAKKAGLDLELAEEDLALLRNFSHARKLAELESDVKQAEMAAERTRRKAAADVVQAEADLRAKQSEFNREKDKQARLQAQIGKARIHAPTEGLVIYATTAMGGWRGNAEPLAAGQEVTERQELIYLPKTASVLAEIKLHESNLDRVGTGLPVRVTVDALPGRSFSGKVAAISPLPDATSMWFNPDLKLYSTTVYLDGSDSALRTGMSCRAEILVARYDAAVYVPVQAVVELNGRPTVYVRQGRGITPRPVTTGLDNNRMIRIIGGLSPGEEVLLTPPFSPPRATAATGRPEPRPGKGPGS